MCLQCLISFGSLRYVLVVSDKFWLCQICSVSDVPTVSDMLNVMTMSDMFKNVLSVSDMFRYFLAGLGFSCVSYVFAVSDEFFAVSDVFWLCHMFWTNQQCLSLCRNLNPI